MVVVVPEPELARPVCPHATVVTTITPIVATMASRYFTVVPPDPNRFRENWVARAPLKLGGQGRVVIRTGPGIGTEIGYRFRSASCYAAVRSRGAAKSHSPRERGGKPRRSGADQSRDRHPAVHLRADGGKPRRADPGQARVQLPGPGGGVGRGPGASHRRCGALRAGRCSPDLASA